VLPTSSPLARVRRLLRAVRRRGLRKRAALVVTPALLVDHLQFALQVQLPRLVVVGAQLPLGSTRGRGAEPTLKLNHLVVELLVGQVRAAFTRNSCRRVEGLQCVRGGTLVRCFLEAVHVLRRLLGGVRASPRRR